MTRTMRCRDSKGLLFPRFVTPTGARPPQTLERAVAAILALDRRANSS